MGILSFFKSPKLQTPAPLPNGSFTVDRTGEILSSTVSSSIPPQSLKRMGALVLKTFREAQPHELSFQELTVNFAGITLCAKELRGGAIIFLSPRGSTRK